jgi:hypothetical protein
LAALALGGACAERELSFEDARLPLGLRLGTARLDVHEPPSLPGVDEVQWMSAGLAASSSSSSRMTQRRAMWRPLDRALEASRAARAAQHGR